MPANLVASPRPTHARRAPRAGGVISPDALSPSAALVTDPVPLTGYVNFRDLGGHAARGGPVTDRSGVPQRLARALRRRPRSSTWWERRVRTVVDLRREHEVEAAPMDGLRAAGVRVEHVSLIDPAIPPLLTPDLVDSTLADRYCSILETSAPQFVSVLE